MELRASGEDYLEAILGAPKTERHSALRGCGPTLGSFQTQRMPCGSNTAEGGFLLMDEDNFLHLTDAGCEVAEQVYEKHRFLPSA